MRRNLLMMASILLLVSAGLTSALAMSDQQYMLAMADMHAGDAPTASPAAMQKPAQPVHGTDVVYATVDGKAVHGYLSVPTQSKSSLPGIIVIHEWWGLNDNIRSMADQLAGEGYAALAVDLYGGKSASNPDEAKKLMSGVFKYPDVAKDNLKQAYAYLHDREHAPRIGVIGWCFGGGWSLQTALLFPDRLNAAVMYYGKPVDDVKALSTLRMPLMGFFGEQDMGISVQDVQAFQKALQAAGVNAEIHEYPDAGHAFANPSGDRYRPAAAADAWKRTLAFFARYLKGA